MSRKMHIIPSLTMSLVLMTCVITKANDNSNNTNILINENVTAKSHTDGVTTLTNIEATTNENTTTNTYDTFAPKTYVKGISDTKTGIKITWKKVNVSKYKIYRSKKKSKGYKPVKTIKSKKTTSYTDKSIKSNTTYYYKIKTYSPNTNTSVSKPVKYKTSYKKLKINFNKQLKKLITNNVNKHYPCNVLVKKYVESSGTKVKTSKEVTNFKLQGSPTANSWKNGYAKVSYNYSLKQSTYKKSGKVKSTTYPVKSSGLTHTAVTSTNDIDSLDAGDIIAYSKGGRATHVAVYIGRFDSKSDLVEYLNTEVGIKCSKNTSWIKSWNGNCKHWVIQGGMGNGNQVYICNNANTTTTGSGASTISHSISLLK